MKCDSNIGLGARHIALLRRIVEAQEMSFPSCSKLLRELETAGFIFISRSDLYVFGDNSVNVRSALDGENFLDEIDASENMGIRC